MKIAVLDDYLSVANQFGDWQQFSESHTVTFFSDHISDENTLIERLQEFDIIMGMRERTPFSASILKNLPNLKLLVTSGLRNASFDIATATQLGILVCGTGGSGEGPTELTWALILGLLRQIPLEQSNTQNGSWGTTLGVGLKGKTIGLLGLGHIGGLVAAIANAFQMNVIAWSQNMTPKLAQENNATLVSKQELFEQSDILSIHVRLSERTRDLVASAELNLMKDTSYIINISRGPIINEQALIEALKQNTIAGAGLDTFDIEPLPLDHPLLHLPNVLITPHIGYVTHEGYRAYYEGATQDIAGFISGSPENMINPEIFESANYRGPK